MRSHAKERLAQLKSVAMFQVCTDKELALVARLAEDLPVRAGDVLVTEGKIGHEFYIVMRGKADITRNGSAVATLGPGDYFGELALLDPQPRNATVTMATDGDVLELSQREFWQLVTDVPPLARKLLQGLARRMHTDQLKADQGAAT